MDVITWSQKNFFPPLSTTESVSLTASPSSIDLGQLERFSLQRIVENSDVAR